MSSTITEIASKYKNVIAAFKNRADVQNGKALGYRKNQDPNGELKFEDTPIGVGQGFTTTGYCVSVSQRLLLDDFFQMILSDSGAKAKLISIDIKEQYYGNCYNGHQNKWHTAVLVNDTNVNFVIDLTCSQFGNNFTNKDIWDFSTWEKSFRSPNCKHNLTDFNGKNITSFATATNSKLNILSNANIVDALHNVTTITDNERTELAQFFLDKIEPLNQKLIIGNINKFDEKYLNAINKLLMNLDFKRCNDKKQYHVCSFVSEKSAKEYLKSFLKENCIFPNYVVLSNSIEENCKYYGIDSTNVNKESQQEETFIVFEFKKSCGCLVDFLKNANLLLPANTQIEVPNIKQNVFNGGRLLSESVEGIIKTTNTIYVVCNKI